MKKILKITGIIIAIIFLLLLTLPWLFKGTIIKEAKKTINNSLNAKVEFNDIDISIFSSFPDLGLTIENLTVTNNIDFDSMRFVDINKIRVDINLLSVIKGEQYIVNEITLKEPIIKAQVNKNGKANWDIVKPDTAKVSDTTVDTSATKFKVALKKFIIEDAHIIFDDRKGNNFYEFKNLTYKLSGNLSNDFTTILNTLIIEEATAKMAGISYLSKAKINIKADVDADLKNQKFTLIKNSFKINALELNLNGWVQMLKDAIDMDIKFNMPNMSFKNILSLVPNIYTKSFSDIQADGTLKFEGWLKGKKDTIRIPQFAFLLDIMNAKFKYPDLPKSVNNINVKLKISNPDGIVDNTVIDLQKFHVELASNTIDAVVLVKKPISNPMIKAIVDGKIDLKTVKDFVPLEKDSRLAGLVETHVKLEGDKAMIDKKEYQKFKAEGTLTIQNVIYKTAAIKDVIKVELISFAFFPKQIKLNALKANIGKSDFYAFGSLNNFLEYYFKNSDILKGEFNFTSNFLDLNQFISSDTTQTKSVAKKEAVVKKEPSQPMKVIEVPDKIDFVLNTKINTLLYDKITVKNISGKVELKERKLMMQALKMELLEGNLLMGGLYSTENIKKPYVNFNLQANKFDIQKTATTFNTIEKINPYIKECFGLLSCNLILKSFLTDTMSLNLNTLYAKGKIGLTDLSIQGENTIKLATALKKENLKVIKPGDINLDIEMKDGKLTLDTFNFAIDNVKGKFTGTYDLNQNMNALAKAFIPFDLVKGILITNDVQNVLNQAAKNDIPITLPQYIVANVTIKGNTKKPEYGVSLDKSILTDLKDEVRKGVENKINKEKERLINEGKKRVEQEKDKLLEKGKNELRKLFPKF